ncbi:glucosaminidase domain-containing protein [Candidatus Chloroploca mongolica]
MNRFDEDPVRRRSTSRVTPLASPPVQRMRRSSIDWLEGDDLPLPTRLRPTPLDELPGDSEAYAEASEPLLRSQQRLDELTEEAIRFEHQTARSHFRTGMHLASLPSAPSISGFKQWIILGGVALLSLLVLVLMRPDGNGGLISNWSTQVFSEGQPQVANSLSSVFLSDVRPPGDYALRAAPSLTPQQIDAILASYGSPATGTGEVWFHLGQQRGIDPAFAVAFFIHESGAGTAQGWAGLKPDGSTTHNVGNIICAGYPTCYGRFRDYPSWNDGIADWYRLIDVEYLQGRGHQTVADIIPVYAPSFENDVNGYVNVVQNLVDRWRTQGVQ